MSRIVIVAMAFQLILLSTSVAFPVFEFIGADRTLGRCVDLKSDKQQAIGNGVAAQGHRLGEPRLGDFDPERLEELGCCVNGSAKLIVGVEGSKLQIQELEDLISCWGGKTNTEIMLRNRVRALSVDVPVASAVLFSEALKTEKTVRYVEPNSIVKVCYTPNDEYWPLQWGPKKIEADAAWNTTVGTSEVLVSVIDTGVDYTHPDLAANYVPLGYDWVNNDTDPIDDHGHGTHCAGIIAATINNTVGIAGIAQVRIMAEKVIGSGGSGLWDWAAQGIFHSTDCGAKIISMSFGGLGNKLLYEAVQYAYNAGVLLVAAAGNEGGDVSSYPASFDEVMAVAATNATDHLASFSSYGDWIDLCAPGVDVYSTLPTYHVTLNDYGYSMNYDYLSGTSMACPHVSGVAALAWGEHPDLTSDEVWRLLQYSADDLGDVGRDRYFGYGRLNAKQAVEGLQEHDLSITQWRHLWRTNPGEPALVNVTISNWGLKNETGFSVELHVNGSLVESQNVDFLSTGNSTTVYFSWTNETVGNYNLTCYVPPVLGENWTHRNAESFNMTVRFAVTIRVRDDYGTVTEALRHALNGDTVLVEDGYYGEGQINVLMENLTLTASGNAVLDGQQEENTLMIETDHVTVEGFIVQNSTCGIFSKGHGNMFQRNNVGRDTGYGIFLMASSNCTVRLCSISNTRGMAGVYMEQSVNCRVCQNNITANIVGVRLDWSSRFNSITGNNVSGNIQCGIHLHFSENNTIKENLLADNGDELWWWDIDSGGISVWQAMNNSILANRITANRHFGIALDYDSNHTSVVDNVFNNDGLMLIDSYQHVIRNNTVNGKPLLYLEGISDYTVSDAGQVILDGCDNIRVENLDLSDATISVLLRYTNNCRIADNIMVDNGWEGIELERSFNNSVINNTITANDWDGVCLGYSSYNTIVENNVSANEYIGITVWSSSNNSIYHNDFIDNRGAVSIPGTGVPSVNSFDNGYPEGGNYWSNLNTTDVYRGQHQNETGSDGIRDMPYFIAWRFGANDTDYYPLTKPYGGPHDIGLRSLNASKMVVGQQYLVNITLKITNYGTATEASSINVYADQTLIANLSFTLSSRNSAILTFSWSTSGFAKGNCTLSAFAELVPDERDASDNTLTGQTVMISIPGDVNGDRKVDLKDVYDVGSRYGSWISSPKYDSNADISNDGKIDLKDYYVVCKNYGKSW